jgi:hypothetical protein
LAPRKGLKKSKFEKTRATMAHPNLEKKTVAFDLERQLRKSTSRVKMHLKNILFFIITSSLNLLALRITIPRNCMLGVLYVLKKTLNYPQLNCQPKVSKLRVVEKYMPKVKRLVGVYSNYGKQLSRANLLKKTYLMNKPYLTN